MKKLALLPLLALCLSVTNATAQVNLNNGLVMYLPFNGNAMDASPNGHNGTVYNASLTTDQNGNANSAYYFNGTSSYIQIPHAQSLNPARFSICAKVNVQGFWNGYCYNNMIFAKGIDRTSGSYSLRHTQTLADDCATFDSTKHNYRCDVQYINCAVSTMNTLPYLKTNSWDCLIGTYDGDTVKMYVNNVLRYAYAEPGLSSSNFSDIFIGRNDISAPGYEYFFHGKIDEIRLYSRVLNAEERVAYCKSGPSSAVPSVVTSGTPFTMSPNPAQNVVSLIFYIAQHEEITISISDASGRNVRMIHETYSQGTQQKDIDISGLSRGMYLIRLSSPHFQQVQKLTKE